MHIYIVEFPIFAYISVCQVASLLYHFIDGFLPDFLLLFTACSPTNI